jgi:D-beta-D-heptose 7-phosphate kinase/D-beta-D-heptose 1-phosphate adenosyltransferase
VRAIFVHDIDPKQVNFPYYRRPSLVTPNRRRPARRRASTSATLRLARPALRCWRWEAEAVLITRGEEGMSLFAAGAPERHFPTVARHVYDVTGAGDTVIAMCALALGAGASLETAALLANHAAGIVVGEVGTATVTAEQLKADLRARGRKKR